MINHLNNLCKSLFHLNISGLVRFKFHVFNSVQSVKIFVFMWCLVLVFRSIMEVLYNDFFPRVLLFGSINSAIKKDQQYAGLFCLEF